MSTRTIVAATDGTESARAAVDWAAREARQTGSLLRIVHAYEWDWAESRYDIASEYVDIARQLAHGVVADAAARAYAVAPGLTVETDVLVGPTIPRLLDVSSSADLLVVGSRGNGGFAGLLLGSVSEELATHAPCPVAVIRAESSQNRTIIAGIDTTPAADHVLETAFSLSEAHDLPLVVIRSCPPAIPLWASAAYPLHVDIPRDDEKQALAQQLAPWRDKFPAVRAEHVLTEESPAAALVTASHRARLVIVGSRGHGRVTGALLGSTGLQLLHHAESPVLVVRDQQPAITRTLVPAQTGA